MLSNTSKPKTFGMAFVSHFPEYVHTQLTGSVTKVKTKQKTNTTENYSTQHKWCQAGYKDGTGTHQKWTDQV